MTVPTVLTTLAMDPAGDRLLEGAARIVVAPDSSAATLYGLIGAADILVVRTHLPPDLLDRPHHLRGIVRHGTGLDMIPMEAATAQSIPVANVPGVNAESVAEYCVGSLIALARQLHSMDRDLHTLGWQAARRRSAATIELAGRTIGIVGLGAIGARLASICHRGFRMRVLGYQRRSTALPTFVEPVELDALCRASDFISINCPLTAATRHLIDERRLRLMAPSALIINAARGPVIDEAALVRALREGWIAGAALDVFAQQPLAPDHPLLSLPNVLLTPHVAGMTQEATRRMSEGTAHEVLRLLAGQRPQNLCNPVVWRP